MDSDRLVAAIPPLQSASLTARGRVLDWYRGTFDGVGTVRLLVLSKTDGGVAAAFERAADRWEAGAQQSGVVTVHDRGETPQPWLAVDAVDGRRAGAAAPDLSVPRRLAVVADAAETLWRFDGHHGGLSPDAIWLAERGTLVGDWGLERACSVAAGETATTPYTPPECRTSTGEWTARADVYSLGAVTYELLTGTPPDGESIQPPTAVDPTLPETVDDVVLTAVADRPANRYDSTYAFKTALLFEASTGGQTSVGATSTTGATQRVTGDHTGTTAEKDTEADDPASPADTDDSRSLRRRAALGVLVAGLVSGVLGATGVGNPLSGERAVARMYRYNAANTGTEPGASGPTGDVSALWRFGTGTLAMATPTVVDGTVYVGSDDTRLYALDAADGSEQWHFETADSIRSSPAVVDGTVYVGSQDRHLYALNAQDGSEQWRFETGWIVDSSPAVATVDSSRTVYVGSTGLYAVDAETGEQRWRFEDAVHVSSSPTVHGSSADDGTVYVGHSESDLFAIDAATGELEWSFDTGGRERSAPAVVDDTVYLSSDSGRVYALDATDGTQQWSFETADGMWASPAVATGRVYAGSRDGNIHALDAETGEEVWSFEADRRVLSSPAVTTPSAEGERGAVYVGSRDNTLYALDAQNGTRLWSYDTDGAIEASPTVADETVFVGSQDGRIHAVAESGREEDEG